MIEIFLAILSGCLIGCVTGLVPGLHVNLIAVYLISVSSLLLGMFNPVIVIVFIVSLAVTHTFLDAIPSIFLGAPDPSMVLTVLPGHQMLLKGRGYEAVKLTLIGSYFCLIVTLMIIPFLVKYIEWAYSLIQRYIPLFLILLLVWMIFLEKRKIKAIYIVLISGILGILVFNMPNLREGLFPMLTGLFGVSSLVLSLRRKEKIPQQRITSVKKIGFFRTLVAVVTGVFSGSITGMVPAVGASQASLIGLLISGRKIGKTGFLILLGGISTVNFVFSLATLYAIGKARNGAVIAMMEFGELSWNSFLIVLAASLIAGSVAVILGLFFAKLFAKIISKINYRYVAVFVILFLFLMVMLISGWIGVIILVASSFTGLLAPLLNTKRSLAMACLIVPVIVNLII